MELWLQVSYIRVRNSRSFGNLGIFLEPTLRIFKSLVQLKFIMVLVWICAYTSWTIWVEPKNRSSFPFYHHFPILCGLANPI